MCLVLKISNHLMCFEGCVFEVNRSGPMKGTITMETLSAVTWLRESSTSFAERLPNENKINLPLASPNIMSTNFFLEKATSPISKYHFYKLWKREMFNVTILKVPKYKKYLIVLNTSVYMEKKLYLNFVT